MDMAEARRRIAVVHQTGRTSLDFSGLGFTALPPEIATLTALKVLELNNNQLTALPPEISPALSTAFRVWPGTRTFFACPGWVHTDNSVSLFQPRCPDSS